MVGGNLKSKRSAVMITQIFHTNHQDSSLAAAESTIKQRAAIIRLSSSADATPSAFENPRKSIHPPQNNRALSNCITVIGKEIQLRADFLGPFFLHKERQSMPAAMMGVRLPASRRRPLAHQSRRSVYSVTPSIQKLLLQGRSSSANFATHLQDSSDSP